MTQPSPSLAPPATWDDITPEWMTAALSAGRAGVVIDAVTVQMRDDGTNRRGRLALTYAEGTGPATAFVKGVDPDHRELIMDVLKVHPLMVVRGAVVRNPFFVPPEEFLRS